MRRHCKLLQGGHDISFNSYVRPRNLLAVAAALIAAAAVGLVLASGNAGAVDKAGKAGASHSAAVPAALTATKNCDKNMDPFGCPTGNGDFKVPAPPPEPTQRLYGANPYH